MLVSFPQVFISQIQIRFFCDFNAGMTENAAQCVNVHAIHQTPLRKIVSQTVRGDAFIHANAPQIVFEVRLEVADLDVIACIASRGEEIISLRIPILVLNPAPHDALCLR